MSFLVPQFRIRYNDTDAISDCFANNLKRSVKVLQLKSQRYLCLNSINITYLSVRLGEN